MNNKVLLSEGLLKEAVIKACEKENDIYDRIIEKEPEPEYSREFRENVMKLREDKKDEKGPEASDIPTGKISRMSLRIKITLVAVIIMLLGSMSVVGIDPMHEMTFRMFEVNYPDHTDITFGEVGGSTIEIDVSSGIRTFDPADFLKRLTWVPEGFEMDREEVFPVFYSLSQRYEYTDSQGNPYQITYSQDAVENCGGVAISSDGSPGKEISICNDKGCWYTDEGGYCHIVMEKDGMLYVVGGNVGTDILARCLESVFEEVSDKNGGISLAKKYKAADFPKKLTWVPEKYVLESKEEYPYWATYMYHKQGTEYDSIRYEQIKIDQSTWSVSDGGRQVEEIWVGKDKAYLLTEEDGGFPEVILAKDGVEHRVSGDCEEEDLIRCLASALDARTGP